jgi:alpha-2-macroglobulin
MKEKPATQPNSPEKQPENLRDDGAGTARGGARPKGIGKIESKVKRCYDVFRKARKEAGNSKRMQVVHDRVDYRLAQRLDSAGHPALAKEITELSEKPPGLFDRIREFYGRRTSSQRWTYALGSLVTVVLLFGLITFGVIWYRGANVPILRNFSDQSHPVLALTKDVETEYGVATSNNSFRIEAEPGMTFRSLGLSNKLSITPEIDYEVQLADDHSYIHILPGDELDPDTEYAITLQKGTMLSEGISLSDDYTWVFRTEPEFLVTGITPRDGTDTAPFDTTIEVEFTYKDIDAGTFGNYFDIVPEVDGRLEHHGKKIVFIPNDDLVKYTVYRVEVKEGFSNSRGEKLPRSYTSTFKVSGSNSEGVYIEKPEMYWSENSPVISTSRDPWIGVSSYQVTGALEFTLYRATTDAVVDTMKDFKWDIYEKPDDEYLTQVRVFTKTPDAARFFPVEVDTYGIYLLEVSNAVYGRALYKYFVYSPVGVVLSDALSADKVWLSDLNRKEPVSGGTMYFYDFDVSEIPVHTASTDNSGYASRGEGGSELIIAEHSGNYAIVLTGRYSSIFDWWMGGWDPVDQSGLSHRAYVHTDRPLYRPGDTVHFKTVLREEDDMSYGVAGGKSVTMRVGESYYYWNNLRGLAAYEETFIVSKDFGTAVGDFEIPPNLSPGSYVLEAVVDGLVAGSARFTIEDFVKPRYQFEMQVDKTVVFTGEAVRITVTGTDYTGDPAAGAQVGLQVSKGNMDYINWVESPGELTDRQYGYYASEPVANTTLTLDAQGRAEYSVTADASGFPSTFGVYSAYIWSHEDYVNFDNETFIVARAETAMFAEPEKTSLQEDGENGITFRTVGLWDFAAEGGVRVVYSLKRSWTEWVEDGEYYDPVTKTHKPVYEAVAHTEYIFEDRELTTDAEGYAEDSLVDLPSGTYSIEAVYYPGEGVAREFPDIFYVYASPEDSTAGYNEWQYWEDKFSIYMDKEVYEVGEIATITVKTPLDGKGIYMAARGDVYDWRVVDFSSGAVTLQQEIDASMAPWVDICVWGIDEYISRNIPGLGVSEQYLSNIFTHKCVRANVSRDHGHLDVEVYPDAETYQPGDTVTLDVRVSDSSGRGVEAEVAVSVVDKALLDVSGESDGEGSGIYSQFYERVRQVAYIQSSVRRYNYIGYGGGGAGGGGPEPRSNFADSAYWDGVVRTDASGNAQVEFVLPDDLTTWVADVVAVTKDTWVGDGRAEFISRKDIRLDANLPSFLRVGDELELELEVVNFSSASLTGQVSVTCQGCEEDTYSANVAVSAGSRSVMPIPVTPSGGADSVLLTATLDSSSLTTHDAVEWSIPVIAKGFAKNATLSFLMEDGVDDSRMKFTVPSDANTSTTEMRVTFARSFVNEWALLPVDPSIASSIDLSSSIIHNSLLLAYYDEIRPSRSRTDFQEKIETALTMLSQNQAEEGGFGWFDHDAVSYETSAYAGIALGRAASADLAPEDGSYTNLEVYLKEGLESTSLNIDEKALGTYALAVMKDTSVLPYALAMKNDAYLFRDSPLAIAYVMLALQELGSGADAAELVPYLAQTAVRTDRTASWSDTDALFRVLASTEYVTALAYQALAPYDTLALTREAETWLIENPVYMAGNSQDAVVVFYALTSSHIENLEGRQGVNKVTLYLNGNEVRTFDVGGDEDSIGKVTVDIPAQYIRNGENLLEVSRGGDGQLYVVNNLTYYSSSPQGAEEFELSRMIRDFESGLPVSSVDKGDVVSIRTTVKVDRDGYNLVVKDLMPSGFEPVRYQLGDYDYEFYSKWWKWGEWDAVVRYGELAQDHITFERYQVEDGEVYVFEFPAVAVFTGNFSGAGAQGYLLGMGDVGGSVESGMVEITD